MLLLRHGGSKKAGMRTTCGISTL